MFTWARRALEVASTEAPELEGRALAVLSRAHSMRGASGDLARAAEIGDRALAGWPHGGRPYELSEHYHMQIAVNYWMGSYERGLELARQGSEIRGLGPQSAEYVIGSFGQIGLNLAGLGRYEGRVAITALHGLRGVGKTALAAAYAERHRGDYRATWWIRGQGEATLRADGPAARTQRLQHAVDERAGRPHLRPACWRTTSARSSGLASAWDDALASPREHWLITGRLAVVRAQLELLLGRPDGSVTWSERATSTSRGRSVGGSTGRRSSRSVERSPRRACSRRPPRSCIEAVSLADALGSPLYRWQARAALAEAVRGVPNERASADDHHEQAVRILHRSGRLSSRRIGRPGTSPRGSLRCSSARADARAQTKLRVIFGPNAGAVIPEASISTSTLTSLAAIRLEELEHPLVRAARLARKAQDTMCGRW
jgi:hypothetical protein